MTTHRINAAHNGFHWTIAFDRHGNVIDLTSSPPYVGGEAASLRTGIPTAGPHRRRLRWEFQVRGWDVPCRESNPSRSEQPLGVPSPRYSYRPGRYHGHGRDRLSAARPGYRHSLPVRFGGTFFDRPFSVGRRKGVSTPRPRRRILSDCPDMSADVPRSTPRDTPGESVNLAVSVFAVPSARRVSPPYSRLQSAIRRIVRRSLREGHCGCQKVNICVSNDLYTLFECDCGAEFDTKDEAIAHLNEISNDDSGERVKHFPVSASIESTSSETHP
jgi:hypothetical protein